MRQVRYHPLQHVCRGLVSSREIVAARLELAGETWTGLKESRCYFAAGLALVERGKAGYQGGTLG